MRNELEKAILQGRYDEAVTICDGLNVSTEKLIETIKLIAYERASLSLYSFARYMFDRTNDIAWLECAMGLMMLPLCYFEGAYSTALFHARQLLQLDNSVGSLEQLLFFHDIPERLVEKDEAILIAKRLYKLDSNNRIAKKILKEYGL